MVLFILVNFILSIESYLTLHIISIEKIVQRLNYTDLALNLPNLELWSINNSSFLVAVPFKVVL